MMHRKRVAARALAAVLVGLVAALWSAAPATSAVGRPEKTSLTVGLPVATGTLVPVYLAEDRNFFKDEGLDVQVVTFQGGSALVKAVLGGSVDIGVGALAGMIDGVLAGQPMKVFYGGFNMPLMSWWAVPSITTVQQARGKVWGITSFGSSTDLLTRYVVQKEGMSLHDVTIVPAGDAASTLAAMQAGRVQVFAAGVPDNFQAQALGYHDILELHDLVKGYPFHVSFAMSAFLDANPDTVTRFLRALVRGMMLTHTDRQAAAEALIKHLNADPTYARETIGTFVNDLYPDGRLPDPASMEAFWQMGLQGGAFRGRPPDYVWLTKKWIETYQTWKP